MHAVRRTNFADIVVTIRELFEAHGRDVNVGEWQAIRGEIDQAATIELEDVSIKWQQIPLGILTLSHQVQPNLPWAEDHFQERVSGTPYNPPPSHEHWPHAQHSNDSHREDGQFSHTYPERFWPRQANAPREVVDNGWSRAGIRFHYGDYSTLVELLRDRPMTRQAYLPIWFPEDLQAASQGERVPCTLGYHFMIRGDRLKLTYYIRSCDFRRHFRDDVYMACRLAQYLCYELNQEWAERDEKRRVKPGDFVMHISSLHIFSAERNMLTLELQNDRTTRILEGLG